MIPTRCRVAQRIEETADTVTIALTTVQARRLRHYTGSQLRLVNLIREEVRRR